MVNPPVNWEPIAQRLWAALVSMRMTHPCDISLCPTCNEAQTADIEYRVLVEGIERRRNEALDN